MLEGLFRVLERTEDLFIAGSSQTFAIMLRDPAASNADVTLIGQSAANSAVALALLTSGTQFQGRSIIWVNEISDTDAYRAMQSGVRGILFRTSPAEHLLQCLRTTAAGEVWLEPALAPLQLPSGGGVHRSLTSRQREIAQMVIQGCPNGEISKRLGISLGTLKVHLTHIYGKLGVPGRVQLALQGPQLLGAPTYDSNHNNR